MNTLNTEKLDPDPGQAGDNTTDWPDGRNVLLNYHRARPRIIS